MLASLHQIYTRDHIPLEGFLFSPKRKSRAVLVWLGGLRSRFSQSPERTHALANELVKKNIAFAAWNHRGFGLINSVKKKRGGYALIGTGFEKFEHCVLDIEAIIRFLRRQGYRKIFLAGHSTGANKAAFYLWKRKGRGLSGALLAGPMADIPHLKRKLGVNFGRALAQAQKLIHKKRKNELLPLGLTRGEFWTAGRFWSIAREGANEDMFPYYAPRRRFRWARNLRMPVLVVIGGKDQCADRPVPEIMERFQKEVPEKFFTGVIIPGADHSFSGKEHAFAKSVANWISRLL